MRTWTVRLGMSLMVVVGLWTSRMPAQECVAPPPNVVVVPTVPFVPEYHPNYPPPLHAPPHPAPSNCAMVRTLNHFGLACQTDSFSAVGSFGSEFRWAFGSSRHFFGEPCIPCTQGRWQP